jgi:hypothetical protein
MPPWNRNATPAAERPADIPLDKSTGRGLILQTRIRLEDGSEFPCALDTGSPTSTLPAAAEPLLGKRLGSGSFLTMDGQERELSHLYAAPRIYLGNAFLETGSVIETWNNPEAILGMDCLCHYCIQLDFAAEKIRFLDPDHLDVTNLGKAFPLMISPYTMIKHAGLFQERSADLLVDTGCFADGYLEPALFTAVTRAQKASLMPIWPGGNASELAELPNCVWDGETYTDIVVGKGRSQNLIGVRFLARHLVTFNFPKRVMYLKRVTGAPLK